MFKSLESAQAQGVALLSIEPDPEAGTVMLSGEGTDYLAVLAYVAWLKSDKTLSDAHLVKHEIRVNEPRPPGILHGLGGVEPQSMKALERKWTELRQALGWKEMLALVLLGLALGFHFTVLRPMERRKALLEYRLEQVSKRGEEARRGVLPDGVADRLAAF